MMNVTNADELYDTLLRVVIFYCIMVKVLLS